MSRRLIALIAAFATLLAAGSAAGQTVPADNARTALAAGAQAMQFQVAPDFQLQSFQGSLLSYKRHLSPSRAIRLGIGLALSDRDRNSSEEISEADTLREVRKDDLEENLFGLHLIAQYLHYASPTPRTALFLGAGPTFEYSRSHQKTAWTNIGYPASEDGISKSFEVGLTLLAGVEWFATRELSLHAEYGLTAGYQWGKSESTKEIQYAPPRTSVEHGESHAWTLDDSGVLFGVSLYF
ncbi:MAG: hypothetical protein ACE15D_10105 [Candidatus Eisenbacteria bacterium]|nr:hypothetical protein [Candidatus Eisenbacteria bacterium]